MGDREVVRQKVYRVTHPSPVSCIVYYLTRLQLMFLIIEHVISRTFRGSGFAHGFADCDLCSARFENSRVFARGY